MLAYQHLIKNFKKSYRLNYAMPILSWDESVMMPLNSGVSFYNFDELIKQAIGKSLSADYYLKHIEERYVKS